MRLADSLTLPRELERARGAGELVVFAGAGVSMGEPSLLPSFEQLAKKIAGARIPWRDEYADKLDAYLGQAERADLRVQERARAFLDTAGEHTALHEHLLGIFGTPDEVRLITTNFDSHFAGALENVFSDSDVPQFVGPALPPGGDFRGIVQLHGSLAWPHNRLVLTDKDFGGAYMADGWAARFLVRAFEGRTILFVGYSVRDPLIQYLLRALNPYNRWFGLWHREEVADRADDGITPIVFDTAKDGDRFGDLNSGLARWHWHVSAPPSDHVNTLSHLLSLGPPASPVDADYVRVRLQTDEGRKVFWEKASGATWFNWAMEEDLLQGLFDPANRDQTTAGWGHWCLTHHCGGNNPRLLRLIRTRGFALQPWFLAGIARHLCASKPLPPPPVTRQLVAIVAEETNPAHISQHTWGWLIDRLAQEGLHDSALLVLRAATRLRLAPPDRLFLHLEAADEPEGELRPLTTRVATLVEPGDLDHSLDRIGSLLAESVPDELLALGTQRIAEAYELLAAASGGDDDFDWLSYGRTTIPPTDQDRLTHGEDLLITLVRIAIQQLGKVAPDRIEALVHRYGKDRRTLFRRLAAYAVSACPALPADEALASAEDHGWPYDSWVRPEFYLLLDTHYSAASNDAVSALVSKLRDDGSWGENGPDEHAVHARFSLAQKLLRLRPDDSTTKDFATAEQAANPTFAEGDPDGYLSRITVGWGGGTPSPITSDELRALPAGEALSRVQEELEKDGTVGEALLGVTQQLATTDPDWGIALLHLTMDAPGSDGLLRSILWGLRESSIDDKNRARALKAVCTREWSEAERSAVGRLIHKWSTGLGKDSDEELLDCLDQTADLLYEQSKEQQPGLSGHGWTEAALNHPAGNAAQVWWRVAEARDWVEGQFVISIEDDEKERWARVATDSGAHADCARPILGMATNRLSGGDYPWAESEVFPLFDCTAKPERAAQVWDGRLMQHRWSWAVVEGLRTYLGDFLERSKQLVPHRSRDIGDWVAFLVAHPGESAVSLTDLHRFVAGADEEALVSFARAIPRQLEALDTEDRERVWAEILAPYWQDRLTNMPAAFEDAEIAEMVSWIQALPEAGLEVVEALEKSPGSDFKHADHLLYRWRQDDDWPKSHPDLVVGVVHFLAVRSSLNEWHADDAVALLEVALEAGADRSQLQSAAEQLVTLGSPRASQLVERIQSEA